MKTKATLEEVVVFNGPPPDGNPYEKDSRVTGSERDAALEAFKDGRESSFTFWYAPERGGSHTLSREQIDWEARSDGGT